MLTLTPPLILKDEELAFALNVLDEAIGEVEQG
jgi:4-aminobutyrate aminotransferase-like enzyme